MKTAARKSFLNLALLLHGFLFALSPLPALAAEAVEPVVSTPPAVSIPAAPAASTPVVQTPKEAAQPDAAPAEKMSADDARLPDQYGMALDYGYVFDPSPTRTFVLARGFAIFDYGQAWRMENCPNTLRFKVEGAIGSTVTPSSDLIVSANMLAMKYPLGLGGKVRPYGEAGIGVIYTQFRVKGQGLHFNFNPLLGAGLELPQPDGKNIFGAVRLHHVSNGGLDHDNRGINSVVLEVGRVF